MVQLIGMNKRSGELGLLIRVTLTDNVQHEEKLASLDGYSVSLRSSEYDGYLIYSRQDDAPETHGPWLWIAREPVDEKIEIIGEL